MYSLFVQIVVDDDSSKEWVVYEAGPKTVASPLICFPPASGTADVYFRQILGLSALGYRVIAVSFTVYTYLSHIFTHGCTKEYYKCRFSLFLSNSDSIDLHIMKSLFLKSKGKCFEIYLLHA